MKRTRVYFWWLLLLGVIIISVFISKNKVINDREKDINETDIILRTELSYYPEGTLRILAFWENNTKQDVMYGQPFDLERYNEKTGKWSKLAWKENIGFTLEGIGLKAGSVNKHIYNFSGIKKKLTEGKYRIKTSFWVSEEDIDITAEFLVTKDSSLLGISELDYSDLENSREIPIRFINDDSMGRKPFPVHAYKNEDTFDTTIVVEGKNYYTNIGNVPGLTKETGKWGVIEVIYAFKDGGETYLVYSFSREDKNKEHHSYIGVYNLTTKKETYVSKAYKNYDIAINYRENGVFNASFMNYEEGRGGGASASAVYDEKKQEYLEIGNFTIKKGKAVFVNS